MGSRLFVMICLPFMFLAWSCSAPTESVPPVQIGFTSNLFDVQPHLAHLEPDFNREGNADTHRFIRAGLQTRDELGEDILMKVREAGYDYIELNTAEIAGLTDQEFDRALQWIRQVGLPVPVTNVFIPGSIKLVGPEIDPNQQNEYLERTYPRLQQLGVEYIVFGSGGARRIPDGFSREEAWDQLVEFGRRAARMAAPYGITILVEPLRSQETNIINTAGEGLQLARDIDHPNFQLMIDFYHLAVENEAPSIIVEAGDRLLHLHIANPEGRVFPKAWDEHPFYPEFFSLLRQTGYSHRLSIEARFDDLIPESIHSIEMMRQGFNPAFPLH